MNGIAGFKAAGGILSIALLSGCASTPNTPAEPLPEPEPAPRTYVEQLSADGLFAFARANISNSGEGREALDTLASKLVEEGRAIAGIQIIGHSDRIGSAQANQTLSTRRAQAVRDYLTSRGVAAHVIQAEGKGSGEPIVECPSERGNALIACLAPNRRVDILVNYAD